MRTPPIQGQQIKGERATSLKTFILPKCVVQPCNKVWILLFQVTYKKGEIAMKGAGCNRFLHGGTVEDEGDNYDVNNFISMTT
jgi:hypothetical protein